MKMRYRLIALIISSGLCGLLNAKDIHIAQNWELVLPVDEFVIIDFPFDIDIKTTPYKRAEMVSKNSVPITNDVELNIPSSDSDLELAQPTKDEPIVTTKTQQGSKISSINNNNGTRTPAFFSKKAGKL